MNLLYETRILVKLPFFGYRVDLLTESSCFLKYVEFFKILSVRHT